MELAKVLINSQFIFGFLPLLLHKFHQAILFQQWDPVRKIGRKFIKKPANLKLAPHIEGIFNNGERTLTLELSLDSFVVSLIGIVHNVFSLLHQFIVLLLLYTEFVFVKNLL